MQITLTELQPGLHLATATGVLDELAEDSFRQQLHPLFRQRDTKLILDLSDVPRINSRGIGILTILNSDANTNGGRMIMTGPSPFVANVFKVTRLETYFEIADSQEVALAKMQS